MSTTSIEDQVFEAIKALNAANKSTNAGQVASLTGLSRQRVTVAATALRHQGKIKDVGKGNAYNWRVVPADPWVTGDWGTTVGTVTEDSVQINDEAIKDLAAKAWATHPNNPERERRAKVAFGRPDDSNGFIQLRNRVAQYLPSNYSVEVTGNELFVVGHDSAGWTLQTYVIPRLASGGITAKEV